MSEEELKKKIELLIYDELKNNMKLPLKVSTETMSNCSNEITKILNKICIDCISVKDYDNIMNNIVSKVDIEGNITFFIPQPVTKIKVEI